MAIRITEDGTVIYENEPEVDRELFPNIKDNCGCQEQIDEIKENLSELQELVGTKAEVIYETTSGSVASFTDGADDMPLKSCVVRIEPIQDGSGDPSPENVRPISGRAGLTVFHSGDDTSDPTTISVNWETEAGTVYGGTLDVISGKLVVLGVKDTLTVVNGQLRSQFFYEGKGQPVTVLGNNVRISLNRISQTSNMNTMSSSYISKMANLCPHYFEYAVDTAHWYINNQLYLYLPKVDVGETLDSYKTFLQDNPFEVYIQFATPTEIQLTPQEIRTLLAENNIWSDAGSMAVEYPADTKMYIEKLTEPTENDMIADHAISANSFFVVGNTLYRATTAIANGATITDGTNAVKMSLSDALNALA